MSHPALQDGSIAPLLADDAHRVVAFHRHDAREAIPVIVNDGSSARTVTIPTTGLRKGSGVVDAISGRRHTVAGSVLHVRVAAHATAILTPASPAK